MRHRTALRRSPTALLAATGTVLLVTVSAVTGAGAAYAYPPTPPSAEISRGHLAELAGTAEGSDTGYDRDLFPHWIQQGASCDTREVVLKRDGTSVVNDSSCRATSGRWYSVYDGVYVNSSSDIDIDHIVPLAEAWRSGADAWTTDRRQSFANDLEHAQLIAVTASSNRSKSDQDPSDWKPTNDAAWCYYARNWIDVKYVYGLAADPAEKTALTEMLDAC
jgi:hypothetical protein